MSGTESKVFITVVCEIDMSAVKEEGCQDGAVRTGPDGACTSSQETTMGLERGLNKASALTDS